MKRRALFLTSLLCLLSSTFVIADDLEMSQKEIDNLGIAVAMPEVASTVGGIVAQARVVIPPSREIVISPIHSGLIVRLDVSEGDPVSRGDLLAEVRSPEFLTLQRDFLDAHNSHALAQNQLNRDRQLVEEGIVSRRRLEETEVLAKAAAASLGEHQQMLLLSGLSDPDIERLIESQKLSNDLKLRAPIDGVVLELTGIVGTQVSATDALYRLGDLSSLWLEIQVPQNLSRNVSLGMKVAVAESGADLPATIIGIGRLANSQTQTITVRAELTHPDHRLIPGQVVSVQIVDNQIEMTGSPTWSVPLSAIVRSDDQTYLFVRTQIGFEVRAVDVIATGADVSYLRHGVVADTRIAVSGVSALKALWLSQDDGET